MYKRPNEQDSKRECRWFWKFDSSGWFNTFSFIVDTALNEPLKSTSVQEKTINKSLKKEEKKSEMKQMARENVQ